MSDDALVRIHSDKMKAIKNKMFNGCNRECTHFVEGEYVNDVRCDCQSKFAYMFNFLKSNVPEHYLDKNMDSHYTLDEVKLAELDIDYDARNAKRTPINGYEQRLNKVADNISTRVRDEGYSFVFFGANGSGKTHAAVWLLCQAIDSGLTGYYTQFKDLYNLYNLVEYKEHEPADKDVLNYIRKATFLVVDELGKESLSGPMVAFLEMLIKERTTYNLPTVFVTNVDMRWHKDATGRGNLINDFLKRYGNSVFDVVKGNYFVYEFSKQGNFRSKKRKVWDL